MIAQQSSPVPFEPGAVVGGKYRVVSLIGMGGVGRVYLARHIELDTEVAIKVLRPEMSERPEAVQRFAREARASVRLRSERIARVLDVGTHEGKPFFVMEYLVGCSLLDIRQQANIDIATLCEFFIQACEGLADAHAQGVVHRDIKPENLFVVRDSSGWRSLKVFDFGISKFSLTGKYSDVDLAAMRTEAMMGTPHYISPEQIRATRDVDHRTDIWSLGAVMFEVLSGGVLPFREEREVTALIAEVLERPHRSLLDVAPNVPERLAAIVDRCLVKDRDFRYQTAAEVAIDLLPLAPARARASAERAVSVTQAAGLMALNGDMESLRSTQIPTSERSLSAPPRNTGIPIDEIAHAPRSGLRPSESLRLPSVLLDSTASAAPSTSLDGVAAAPPPMPLRRSAAISSAPAEPERATGPALASLSAVQSPESVASTSPIESMEPVAALARSASPGTTASSVATPVPDVFDEDHAKRRTRKVALVAFLVAIGSLAALALLFMQSESSDPGPTASAVRAPALPHDPVALRTATVASPVAPALAPSAATAAHSADAASTAPSLTPAPPRSPAPPKPTWAQRPAPAPAPKATAMKSPEPPPPTNKLELRRER